MNFLLKMIKPGQNSLTGVVAQYVPFIFDCI